MLNLMGNTLIFIHTPTGKAITPAPWQIALKVGDCCLIERDGLPPVYCRLVKARPELGWFMAERYSEPNPTGNQDSFCIIEASRLITPDEFEQARALGWRDLWGTKE